MYHSFLIHSSANGHLGCFHVLAIINSAVMNIEVHVSLSILVSLVCMPSSGIAGSEGNSISSFLRQEKSQINNLTLHLRQLEKEEMENSRVSRRKEILKIRAEISVEIFSYIILKIQFFSEWL